MFLVHDTEIEQILFCDNSDSEETLLLDDKNISFLAKDYEYFKKNMASGEMLESTINSLSVSHSSSPSDYKLTNILQINTVLLYLHFQLILHSNGKS